MKSTCRSISDPFGTRSSPGGEAAVRRARFALADPRAFFVPEARMRDVSHACDPVPTPEALVETRAPDLARRALGLRAAVDEFVTRLCLPLADERDLDHDESPSSTYGTARLKGLRSAGIRRATPSPIG